MSECSVPHYDGLSLESFAPASREIPREGLKRTLRRKTKTRNGRTVCWDSLERIGFGYQTSVADVNEDVIGGKKSAPRMGLLTVAIQKV